MTGAAAELLDRVHELGFDLLRVGPDSLRIYAPLGALTAELRAELKAHKRELLEYLAPHPCARCGRFAFPLPGVVCFWCRRGSAG